MAFKVPEEFRMTSGPLASDSTIGNNGAFAIKLKKGGVVYAIASDQLGWEHVSITKMKAQRPPTWGEMCEVKDLFWDAEDCVMQLHPPKSEYVNNHPNCLHLWRPVDADIPRPPSAMVGAVM